MGQPGLLAIQGLRDLPDQEVRQEERRDLRAHQALLAHREVLVLLVGRQVQQEQVEQMEVLVERRDQED